MHAAKSCQDPNPPKPNIPKHIQMPTNYRQTPIMESWVEDKAPQPHVFP